MSTLLLEMSPERKYRQFQLVTAREGESCRLLVLEGPAVREVTSETYYTGTRLKKSVMRQEMMHSLRKPQADIHSYILFPIFLVITSSFQLFSSTYLGHHVEITNVATLR